MSKKMRSLENSARKPATAMNADDRRRYEKHLALPHIGPAGQARLKASSIAIIGCGALGSAQAQVLVRAGVGAVRLVDRDVVEISNLHRQMLFDEEDARLARPKVKAAQDKLARINSACHIEAHHADANPETLPKLIAGSAIVLDATDNVETRLSIDAACRRAELPWIYGGVLGTQGVMVPMPVGAPCLRCLFGEPPAPGELPGCAQRGVLSSVVLAIAALQATAALKFLVGEPLPRQLVALDVWEMSLRRIALTAKARVDCECSTSMPRNMAT